MECEKCKHYNERRDTCDFFDEDDDDALQPCEYLTDDELKRKI
jgi:hypothetical protein